MTERDLVIDLFAGMGGWSCAAAARDLDEIGIEYDEMACRTAVAGGHRRLMADVATFPFEQLAGRVVGIIASPPCTDWSMSGKRAGLDGETGALVLEVDRWVRALQPRWVACEQVPPAVHWWNRFAHEWSTELGYSTWSGVLNSADYGVPQTRERAILIASRDRRVGPPPATHAKNPMPSLFGPELEPWISMARALGWTPSIDERYFDPEAEPAQVVCGNITPRWAFPRKGDGTRPHRRTLRERIEAAGLDPDARFDFGDVVQEHGAVRDDTEPAPTITSSADNGNFAFRVGFPRLDDLGTSPDGYRERDWSDDDEPAFTVTEKARSWVVQTGNPSSSRTRDYPEGERPHADDIQYQRDLERPAPTLSTRGDLWQIKPGDDLVVQTGNNSHVTSREGSKAGEGGVQKYERSVDEPAPTLDTQVGSKWKINADDERRLGAEAAAARYGDRAGTTSIKLDIVDALILQSFDPDYPVQGNKSKTFEQVGNAIPPLLAWHVLGQVIGDE